jgi:hypothetical protein
MNQPVTFSYKIYKNLLCPIVKFSLRAKGKWIDVESYVDSGASVSLFSTMEAQRLSLDYRQGKRIYSMVDDGNLIPVYLHKLTANLGEVIFAAEIGFSPSLGVGFNLMGRRSFFTAFDILFSDSSRKITFIPRK